MREGRQLEVLRRLRRSGAVSVAELAQTLGVAEMTIRRDLDQLAARGALERVHGGAVLLRSPSRGGVPAAMRIGLLAPDKHYYYQEVISGAEEAAAALGYRIFYGAHRSHPETELQQLDELLGLDLDGLIVTPGHNETAEQEFYRRLSTLPLAVVICERTLPNWPHVVRDTVASDHENGVVLGLRHLWGLGHRRLAWASATTATSEALERGIERVARRLECDLLRCPPLPWRAGERQQRAIAALLDQVRDLDCTALFVHSDIQALSVLDAVLDRGWRVPEDLSLVTYDDVLAEDAKIPLTAVGPAKRQLGARAVELLHRRISNHAFQTPIERVELLPALKERASSTVPRVHPLANGV